MKDIQNHIIKSEINLGQPSIFLILWSFAIMSFLKSPWFVILQIASVTNSTY